MAMRKAHSLGSSKQDGRSGRSLHNSLGSGYGRAASTGLPKMSAPGVNNPFSSAMIADINDLVYTSDDENSRLDFGFDDVWSEAERRGGTDKIQSSSRLGSLTRPPMGTVLLVAALVAIVAAASMAIGYAVVVRAPDGPARHPIGGEPPSPEQELLEVAERVVAACGEEMLDRDMSGCQRLCRSSMCCFGGDYSCEEDEGRDCAAYAGCEALVMGVPADVAEEDEE